MITDGYRQALASAKSWLRIYPEAAHIIEEIDKQLTVHPVGYFWMTGLAEEWHIWYPTERGIYCQKSGNYYPWATFDENTSRGVWRWKPVTPPVETPKEEEA